jgi:GGDEF domain-containing protein
VTDLKSPEAKIEQALRVFTQLTKAEDPKPSGIDGLKAAAKAGSVDPETFKRTMREIYEDKMIPGFGNRKAYQDYLKVAGPGIHVRLDLNDMKSLHRIHGHKHVEDAVKSAARTMHAVAKKAGLKQGTIFHVAGDEFHTHLPDFESAAKFVRDLREEVGRVPDIGGTHRLTFSVGMGDNPERAQESLSTAQKLRDEQHYLPGRHQHHVHSLVPGKEGAVPVPKEEGVKPPPPPQKV